MQIDYILLNKYIIYVKISMIKPVRQHKIMQTFACQIAKFVIALTGEMLYDLL